MSNPNQARRTELKVQVSGADISKPLKNYLLSLTYTDNAETESDDLQITLQDRDGVWLNNWLDSMVQSDAASKGVSVKASIVALNWRNDDGKDVELDCGAFELDSIQAKGPPATVTLKCVALPFSSQIRQTKKSKAWEKITLSAIANEIAGQNGLSCMYESANDPFYKRREQSHQSDIAFLIRLCQDAGISLKATDSSIVLFDQSQYEVKAPVLTIKYGEGYTSYSLATGSAGVMYQSCKVRYTDPETGEIIEGTAYTDDYDSKSENNACLDVWTEVADASEAQTLAQKRLRLHNKFERTGTITLPGNPSLVAGVTVKLEKFGAFNGKYIVQSAKHNVGASGYTTQITIRRILEGL